MWQLADKTFSGRLILGTAGYPSPAIMQDAIRAAGVELVTVSLRRQSPASGGGRAFWELIRELEVEVLPNTAGCHSAGEAITTALMARELFATHWIKLEVIGNDYTLQPDVFALVEAAQELSSQGFEVFPYCTEDLVVCERLVEAGCRVLMPWGAPIGTGRGLQNIAGLERLRAHFPNLNLIVDAGIGAPSHATQALEMGYDGVLLNTAVAEAIDPVQMAAAFKQAVQAGRQAQAAGLMERRDAASASTPEVGKPFWHEQI